MKKRIYSENIAHVINDHLTKNGLRFSFDKVRGLFMFDLLLRSKLREISYIITVKDNRYIVYAYSPVNVDQDDEKMMATMAEFICRANYGLIGGNFEFDMRDGEISYKYYVDCEGFPSEDMIRRSIQIPAIMFKRYGVGMIDIMFGNASAKAAVDRCEKAIQDDIIALLREMDNEEDEDDDDFSDILAGLVESLDLTDDEEPTSKATIQCNSNPFGVEGGDEQ